MSLKKTLHRLLKDEEGQSTTEYILILAVVVMIAMKFKSKIGDVISGATDDIGGRIQSGLDETLQ